jgi:hypothetical protein
MVIFVALFHFAERFSSSTLDVDINMAQDPV